jgi:hypothetical protein
MVLIIDYQWLFLIDPPLTYNFPGKRREEKNKFCVFILQSLSSRTYSVHILPCSCYPEYYRLTDLVYTGIRLYHKPIAKIRESKKQNFRCQK